jgi:hypothetical protein
MYKVPPSLQMTLTQLSVPALLAALLAAVSTAAQTAVKKKPTVNIVKSNTRSMNLNLFEALTTTRTTDCYDYDDTTSCIEPCGGTSYYINAFTMIGDIPMIDVSADFYDNCAGADGTYYSACAMVKVPPATWVQFQKTASLKLTAKLGECEGSDAGTNPLIGTTIDVDVKLTCATQTIDNSRCSGSSISPVVSNNYKYKYVSMNKACNFEAIPGLKVNGKPKTFDNVSFGTSKTKDINFEF